MRTPGLTGAVLGVAAVFGISWIAAIAYWRLGTRVPGPGEIAGLLLGMPACLSGVMAWWRRREPATDATWREGPADAAHREPPAARFAVLATALELPVGHDPADVLARSMDGAGLRLHPRLRDPRGHGLLAAEVAGLDTARLDAELAELAAMPPRARPEVARALALADPILEQLLDAGHPAPVACGLLLPADWSDAERELARRWLEQRIAAADLPGAGPVSAFPVASAHELFRHLRSALPVDAEPRAGPRLWLAVSSSIGTGSVDRLARRSLLLGAATPQGRAPGEGAAGVLLEAWTDASDAAVLHLPDPATPAPPDHASAGLGTLIADALATTGIDAGEIGLVVSDVDHHAGHCTQLAAATSTHLPRLDPARGVIRLGLGCGHADAVLALAGLALAAHRVDDAGEAALVVGIHATDGPAIALVAPPAPSP